MAIIKAFAARHTVQFAWIWCFGVRHPIVADILEQLAIEMGALLLTEIGVAIGTILQSV